MHGKIVKGIAGFYYVHAGEQVYECKARGLFRKDGIKPLVGDNVLFDEGLITDIDDRKNSLIRPAVANVDQALVIFASMSPEPNLNLLDRFLVMMETQEVPVIICFNKNDLVDEKVTENLTKIYKKAGYKVLSVSVKKNEGVDELKNLLMGKTTVLAGPSGVGKSSFINLVAPSAGMETGSVSEKIKRGKHTTRHSELFYVCEDTYIMDTPGFSSLYIEELDEKDLKDYFPEFKPYEDSCRFLSCIHIGERDCAVKDAVETGQIEPSRYENYKLIYEELKNRKKY
ncbi:MAG: ribosome small subunit-dependent GTPase A [Lachnospiraceae bacterium]|nr:ribosome small subunit-dependent GTPase A [Lachnospiraceae bacterium]